MMIDATRLLTLHHVTTMNSTIGYYERCREFRRLRRARRFTEWHAAEQVDKFLPFRAEIPRFERSRASTPPRRDETLNV